jgi:hypothetical protein
MVPQAPGARLRALGSRSLTARGASMAQLGVINGPSGAGRAPNERAQDRGEMGLYHRDLVSVPGVSVAQVARRYSMDANLIFNWLRDTLLLCR